MAQADREDALRIGGEHFEIRIAFECLAGPGNLRGRLGGGGLRGNRRRLTRAGRSQQHQGENGCTAHFNEI